MPEKEDDTDLRKKVQDVWGSTLSGVELPGQSIKPAAARQTMPAPGAEPVRLPTVPLGTPEGEAPSRAAQIEILDVIGEGGMGTIYRARQVSLDREVALKQIKPHLEMRQDVIDMFLGEAHATGALDHPNIVPVYELGRDDRGQAFYSMKLVHGTPWNKLLHPETDEQRARADSMSVRDHLDILLKVSDAIGFAHSRGVIHRDLKPENVMVGEFGEVLVMDWGLAAAVEPGKPATRRLPDVTKVTAACGTPSYMPPEMALGEGFRTCAASDVYLLGAVLFEILFGHPPHQGETVWAVLLAASENRIAKPEKAAPEVRSYYQALRVTLNKSLNIHPARRQPDARAFGEEVREALSHFDSVAMATDAHERIGELTGEATGATPARARKLYAGFAEAVAGLKQSLRSWPENPLAGRWLAEAHVEYARLALAMKDFALAQAQIGQVGMENDEAKELRHDIRSAQKEALARERSARLMRWGVTAAALVVFGVMAAAFFWVRSEQKKTARQRDIAEENLAKFRAEQERGRKIKKESAPAILVSAQLAMSKNEFDPAFALASAAADYDPELVPARVLKGRLLTARRDYAGALAEFDAVAELGAGTPETRELAAFLREGLRQDTPEFRRRLALALTRHNLPRLAGVVDGSVEDLFETIRVRIEKAWPGMGSALKKDGQQRLHLSLKGCGNVRDLSPIEGVPLCSLDLGHCQDVADLGPLSGMPLEKLNVGMYPTHSNKVLKSLDALQDCRKLKWLSIAHCRAVESLEPLRGLPLTYVNLKGCEALRDLSVLKDLPLAKVQTGLDLRGCRHVSDLTPLVGMPLEKLNLGTHPTHSNKVLKSLDGLQECRKLKWLNIANCRAVESLEPLRGLPLTYINPEGCEALRDLSVLKDLPLAKVQTALDIRRCRYVSDLTPLQGMPLEKLDMGMSSAGPNTALKSLDGLQACRKLKWLSIANCRAVESIEPLKGMRLTRLNLERCAKVSDLSPLAGMPLEYLNLKHCESVRDVSVIKGMPLKSLQIARTAVGDLGPLKGFSFISLDLGGCPNVSDLTPLVGMPLTSLSLGTGHAGEANKKLYDLSPLRGMRLTRLNLEWCAKVSDLSPLAGMPLEYLNLKHCESVRDISVIKGMPLKELGLRNSRQLSDVAPLLRGMPLTSLSLGSGDRNRPTDMIRDLSPLRGMRLTRLEIENCREVSDLTPLKGMPLVHLNIKGCTNIRDLSPLKGMRIKELLVEGSGVGEAQQAPVPRKKPRSEPRPKEGEGDKDVF